MFIKNMSKRERSIALAAISFVAAAILYNLMIDPVIRSWQELNAEIESKSSALKNQMAMLSARDAIAATYSKFDKYVKSGKSEEETIADTLLYLEGLSRGDSCLVVNIKPIGTKKYVSYKELLIELSSEGSVKQFTKFLYDVENTKNMILKVRHFILTSKAGQEGALRGNFLISKLIVD
jgi:hypothetical protein